MSDLSSMIRQTNDTADNFDAKDCGDKRPTTYVRINLVESLPLSLQRTRINRYISLYNFQAACKGSCKQSHKTVVLPVCFISNLESLKIILLPFFDVSKIISVSIQVSPSTLFP